MLVTKKAGRVYVIAALLIGCTDVMAQPVLLDMPTRVAVDSQGNVFVLEPGQKRVARFDANGTLLRRFGSSGTGAGQFLSLHDITTDPAGNVLVLDRSSGFVSRFGNDGTFMNRWQVGLKSNGLVATTGRVFVSKDGGSLSAYSSTGQFLSQTVVIEDFSGRSDADTPGDLAMDGSGNLYVTDRANGRVLRFGTSGPDSDPLVWRGWIGGCSAGPLCQAVPGGSGPSRTTGWCSDFSQCGDSRLGVGLGRFSAPVYVSSALDGSINVTDFGGGIQRFNPSGAYAGLLAVRGRDPGQTGDDPTAVVANGDILAVQTRVGRISRFASSGLFRGVFGGGVELSVFPGNTQLNPLRFTTPGTAFTTVAILSLGGYEGPLTLLSVRCIPPRGVPAVPCSTLGISTSFANPTASVSASPAAIAMGITVSASTPDGGTLVVVENAPGSIPAFTQLLVSVALQRGLSVRHSPTVVTLMPGDPAARVSVAVASTNVTGSTSLSGAFTPVPPAGHLQHQFTPSGVFNLAANASLARSLDITALEKARTGIFTLNVKAQGSNANATSPVEVRVECNCSTTGDFVLPSVQPVTVTSALTGTSPDGRFIVTTASVGLSATVSIAAQSLPAATLVGPVSSATSWGFSPNSRFFVVTSAGPSSHITMLDVYDLNFQNHRMLSQQITSCPMGNPTCAPPPSFCYGGGAACMGGANSTTAPSFRVGSAAWGFGPNSKSFVLIDVNPLVSSSQYNLQLFNLMTTPTATRIASTSGRSISAFWRYSPCGDLLMHFHQAFATPSSNDEANFYQTFVTREAAPAERASLIVASDGTVRQGPVGARVDNAFFSTGNFDVRLLNLSRSSGTPATGFQSLQCRR